MKYLLALLLLTFTFAGHAAHYESMRVAKIDLIPENLPIDSSFQPSAVRARLNTKVGSYFSQAEFDGDLKMLAEEYDQVEPSIEVMGGEIYITMRIWFKPVICNIYFGGNSCIKTKKLKKTLDIHAGDLFDREAFIEAFNSLKFLYIKKGYFEAELGYELVPVNDGCGVDIYINVCEGRAGKINEIRFCGLSACEEDEVMDEILSKPYNMLLSWYTGRGVYHPDMIEHDRLQIINFFQNQGYADALVEICIEEAPRSDRINVVITVDKGVCYTIGNITLEGNTLFTSEQVYNVFTFGINSRYSPEQIRNTIRNIQDLYGVCGYVDTNVDLQLFIREGCAVYDVAVSIEEGCQYYVGLIKVFGNQCTQTNVILHECLLCPGEVFDNRKLEGTEARLGNTGFFSAVNVYAVSSQINDFEGERLYRDIYVEVEERDTGNLGLFAGFSSLDRIFGGVELTEQNFNIAGLTRIFDRGPGALRGGGEYAHAKINIGDKQTSYIGQWTKPYFLDTPWILGVDLEKSTNRALSKGYTIKTYGGNVHGTYILNDYLKYDIYYRGRHSKTDVKDDNNPLLRKEGMQSGYISAIGNTLIYDSTDRPRRPTCGLRSRLGYELAGIGGNYDFMKFTYLNTYYYPFSKRGTFKARADLQFIKTYGSTEPTDLPLSERLFLGGETTVRGYRNFIIGPKFGNNEPRGGVSSLLLSEEYQHNLLPAPCLDAFVFCDAGYVSLSEFTIGSWAASVGFGIRIEVMRGMPMMMGLGWPIHPGEKLNGQELDNTQRFFFAVGGSF